MISYILRRLLYTVPLLLGVALMIFIIFYVAVPSPVSSFLGKNPRPEEITLLEHELGLDQSLPMQFVDFLRQIVTFNYGKSFQTNEPILNMIRRGIVPSLCLSVPAFMMSIFISIFIGMLCARFNNTWFDKSLVIFSVLGMSVSSLAFILAGQYLLAFKWRIFPVAGFAFGLKSVKYLMLPWLIWVISSIGGNVRFYRTVLMNEIRQEYVRTAYAKGLSSARVFFSHILPNAMIPIITQVVIAIPFLYTGSLLLENFFSIPGLGGLQLEAIMNNDWPVMKALTMTGSLLYIIANLISDILYSIVDPRIKLR